MALNHAVSWSQWHRLLVIGEISALTQMETALNPDNAMLMSWSVRNIVCAAALYWSEGSCDLWANLCCAWAHFDSRKTTSAAFIDTWSASSLFWLTLLFCFCSFIIQVPIRGRKQSLCVCCRHWAECKLAPNAGELLEGVKEREHIYSLCFMSVLWLCHVIF